MYVSFLWALLPEINMDGWMNKVTHILHFLISYVHFRPEFCEIP